MHSKFFLIAAALPVRLKRFKISGSRCKCLRAATAGSTLGMKCLRTPLCVKYIHTCVRVCCCKTLSGVRPAAREGCWSRSRVYGALGNDCDLVAEDVEVIASEVSVTDKYGHSK
eukprot:361740-Chlamydomonas_euryale.AAC.5